MPVSKLVTFTLKPEAAELGRAAIETFLLAIRQKELGRTLLYKSFQQRDNPLEYVHMMTFKDAAAEEQHKSAVHTQAFVAALYPACAVAPVFSELQEVQP